MSPLPQPPPASPVWITGAGGLLGHSLTLTAPPPRQPSLRPLTRHHLDLTNHDDVRDAFRRDPPACILHCAALSKSPACQANPAAAQQVNVDATARLAELAADRPFLFLSTDLVFDGRQGHYREDDPVNPLSVYAETKAQAERIVLANPRHTVIRTSLNGGTSPTGDRGFNEEMRRAWRQGQTLTLFDDEFRCPIPALVTARAIWEFVDRRATGLWHLAGAERLSRWEIGQTLAARWPQLHPQLRRASLHEYSGAPRPPDTSLDCTRAQSFLSFPLPAFRAWLAAHPDLVF